MEIIMRYHYKPPGKANIRNTNNTNRCLECRATETLRYCWSECKMIQLLSKIVWKFYEVKYILTLGPSNLNPRYLSKRNKEICL